MTEGIMTYEELIGQSLVFGIPGTQITDEIVRHFKETHCAGLILYRINFDSPDQIRKELGIPTNRGLRYSWGYPACPDHMQHEIVYRLLPARALGMNLTELGALVPELSTAALVVHHPEAKYFSAQ